MARSEPVEVWARCALCHYQQFAWLAPTESISIGGDCPMCQGKACCDVQIGGRPPWAKPELMQERQRINRTKL